MHTCSKRELMAIYWVQVSEDFDPVSVDLADAEVTGVRKLLEALADAGELVDLSDSTGNTIYDNYSEWRDSKINSATKISAAYPDFSRYREAKACLDAEDPDKVALVESCRKDLLSVYSDYSDYSDDEYGSGTKISEILRDYKSAAAEDWDDCTVEEADILFDNILDALDVIHKDDSAAWW